MRGKAEPRTNSAEREGVRARGIERRRSATRPGFNAHARLILAGRRHFRNQCPWQKLPRRQSVRDIFNGRPAVELRKALLE